MLGSGVQRRRIMELVAREKGEEYPELVVEHTEAQFGAGAGRVKYRRTENAPLEYLDLTPEQARYIGIDLSTREPRETGGA